MSKLGFIKRHYKGFLLFSGCCLVLLSLGFNMIIPFFDKRFNQAEIKEQVKEESSALGTQLNVDSISTDAYVISTNDSYAEAGSSGTGTITNTTRLLVGQQNQTIWRNQTTQASAQSVYLGSVIRTGQTILAFPQGVITQVDLMLYKAGTPTGTASVTVRNMASGTLIGTIGTIDVATLTTTATWKTFSTTPIKIDTTRNLRINIEYSGGTSSNYLRVRYQASDVYTFGFRNTYTGTTYTNQTTHDCAFRIKYYNVNVSRGMLFFDTSSIPDNAFIDNATLRLYASNDYSTTDFYLLLKNGMNTYPHRPLIVSDFKKTNYYGIGGNKTTAGLAINYNNIPLNAVGLNWINKTSFTKLCLMSARDSNGNSPTGNEYVSFYSSEQGANYKPQLIVNYTVPTWNENDWFYEDSAQSYGKIPKLKVNHTRAWHDLKNHAKWVLQWYDGYSWIDSSNFINNNLVSLLDNYTQKFALQFTPPYAGDYRLQLTVDYVLDSYNYDDASKTYSLLYHNFAGTNLTFTFSYLDISQLPGLGFSNYINPQGQFIFNITRTVSANEVNTLISLDPTYGIMPAAVTDSYEWNGATGNNVDMLRLGTSEYYLQAYTGPSSKGWVNTTRVWNDNGTIRKATIDSLNYVAYGETENSLCWVYGDIYAVVSNGAAGQARISTFEAKAADGQIGATAIDNVYTRQTATYNKIIKVSGNMFVVTYCNNSYSGGWVDSVYISNTGIIPATTNDSVRFNGTYCRTVDAVGIDSNTFAVVYESSTTSGSICTYNVSATTGDITNTKAYSEWAYATRAYTPDIMKVSGNVFAIAYADTNSDIQVKTLTIADTGSITKSFIDTLSMGAETAAYPKLFTVNSLSVYGITYQWTSADGVVKTFNMTSAGQIGAAIIDYLEFDTNDCMYWSTATWVNKSWYYIAYTSTGNDGWSRTVSIDTNWASPTFSSPSPTNASTGQALTPQCAITVNDLNGDAMTVNFYENSTGSYILRQTNSSCANGTYRWTDAQATANSHAYWWKVYCNDGVHNSTAFYKFTTLAAASFPDSPSPFTASKRDSSCLALAWTKGAGADYTRIQRDTVGYPATIAAGTNVYNNTGSSYLNVGLAAGTPYYYSAWSWNTTNKQWSINPANALNTTKAYASLWTSTLTGGNITTVYRSLFTSLLTGGNVTTIYRALFTSTLTGGNITSTYKSLFTSTLTGGNISTTQSLFVSLLTGGNVSLSKSLFTSLLTGGNVTTTYRPLFTSLLTGGNITSGNKALFTSLLTGGNITAYASLFTSTLTGGNISSDKSLFTSLLTGGNITITYKSFFTSLLTGGNVSLGTWTSLFTSNLSGGNTTTYKSIFTSTLTGGNITTPHSLWTSLLTGGNTSALAPATPYNMNLLVINPNPGNGTHNTNYLKSNASGLTTSIDIFYENFTTPAALMPGDYSMTIIGTTPANTPVIWNTSAVYATVHDTLYGIITPGNPYVGQYYLNPNYDIFRSFLLFNTGLIPNEAIINSAYIQLVVYDDYSDDDFNVTVQETKLPVPHNPLITLDYYKNSFSNYFGHTNTTGYTDEDIFNIALTPLGVAFLEKSDETAFGIRSDQDINSSAPTGDEFVIFYGYGVATAKYPKLIVNFTIPPSNWAYFVNLTWYSNSSGAWTKYYESYINSNGTTTVPAINFSGIDTYFWHLEWESNKTNNGSSQIFTFTTVNTSGGTGASMNGENRFAVGLISGFAILLMIGVALLKHMKKKRNGRKT